MTVMLRVGVSGKWLTLGNVINVGHPWLDIDGLAGGHTHAFPCEALSCLLTLPPGRESLDESF